jgi:hypothetical protein
MLLASVGLAACQTKPAPTPTPTTVPTLNVSLWVDYPVVSISLFNSKKYYQYANVTVTDVSGKPVPGVTVIGQCAFTKGLTTVIFPVTNANGQARAPLALTPTNSESTHIITVTAIRNADWSLTATTSFDVYP